MLPFGSFPRAAWKCHRARAAPQPTARATGFPRSPWEPESPVGAHCVGDGSGVGGDAADVEPAFATRLAVARTLGLDHAEPLEVGLLLRLARQTNGPNAQQRLTSSRP